MRIGIDIDDTITNSTPVINKYIKEYGSTFFDASEFQKKKEELSRGILNDEIATKFFSKYAVEISDHIELKEDAKEIIDKLHNEGHEIIIITARRDNYYKDAYAYCTKYLKSKNVYYDKLITEQVYKDKTCINEKIDLMIDDAIDTCETLDKLGIKTLLFTSEINKNKDTKIPRVNFWKEVYNYIHNL